MTFINPNFFTRQILNQTKTLIIMLIRTRVCLTIIIIDSENYHISNGIYFEILTP